MLQKSWKAYLQPILTQTNKRIAIVGMGHLLRGDDAAGLYIIYKLRAESPDVENVLLLDAGSAPENFTGKIRQFAPDVVLFIDAVDMQAEVGCIRLIELNTISDVAASTHTLSLRLLSHFLQTELSCEVLLLGIQPQQSELISRLSSHVENCVDEIVQFICAKIHK